MTQDEIIQMAHLAVAQQDHEIKEADEIVKTLTSFAELVAAKEREACAKVCDQFDSENPFIGQAQAVANAIRERGHV